MRKKFFIITMLITTIFLIPFAANAYDVTGRWDLSVDWGNFSTGNLSGTHSDSSVIIITNTLNNSNDFIGEFHHRGKLFGVVCGRIIQASNPYKRDIIVIKRIDKSQKYYAIYTGLMSGNNKITQRHFVDTYGNSGSFEMHQ